MLFYEMATLAFFTKAGILESYNYGDSVAIVRLYKIHILWLDIGHTERGPGSRLD
tara:strand:+ start:434 stop:598 length:165 start_codon:yes stop_codon:yes gene_type:complete